MELEEAIKDIKIWLDFPVWFIHTGKDEDFLRRIDESAIETILNHLTKQEKRISDLEFALMDMVVQFADESKDSINTGGLSALEAAFSELDFDNPMPIKKVHEQYKKLAKQYYEKKAE